MSVTLTCGCRPVAVTLVGDILVRSGGPVFDFFKKVRFDAQHILGEMYSDIAQADIFFANFEGTITTALEIQKTFLPNIFSISSDPAIVQFLDQLNSRSVLSFANNHAADFGLRGIQDTLNHLRASNSVPVGIGLSDQLENSTVFKFDNLRVTFVALTDMVFDRYCASETTVGILKLNDENLRKAILAARALSDIVIVYLHTVEDIWAPFTFLPDTRQSHYAHLAVDAGADLVVGNHSHGLQKVETYKGKYIFHSLGAFIYNPDFSSKYPPGNKFHHSTQFYGGALLKVVCCRHGVRVDECMPTRTSSEGDGFHVVPASFFRKLRTKLSIPSNPAG